MQVLEGCLLNRTRKRQLMSIRVAHMKISLAPCSVSRPLRMKSLFPKVCPGCINIGYVENHPPPMDSRIALL